jgi:hypothetical protein
MIMGSIKRLFGFGKVSAQQSAPELSDSTPKPAPVSVSQEEGEQCYTAVATMQREAEKARQHLLASEQQAVDSQSKSDLKKIAGRFSRRNITTAAASIKEQQKQIDRAIKALIAHRAGELKLYESARDASIALAKKTLKQLLAEAKDGFDRAVAELLPIENAARTLAEKIYSDKVSSAESSFKAAITGAESVCKTNTQAIQTLVEGKIAQLKARLAELEQEQVALKIDPLYDRIDMGFLKLRKSSPDTQTELPLFAVFSLSDPICEITCTGTKPYRANANQATYKVQTSPPLLSEYVSASLWKLKSATERRLEQSGRNDYWSEVTVTGRYRTEFSGVIPPAVREIIKKAQKQFDNIYIVTEAPDWELSFQQVVVSPVPVGDPLVIGEKAGLFWLVNAFDTTPAEEHAWREFSRNTKENRN